MRAVLMLAALAIACDAPGENLDADAAPELDAAVLADAGPILEADAGELDAGRPALDARVGEPDAGPVDERDAGPIVEADAGPGPEPLPTCVGEGIQRYDTTWCDYVPRVIDDYDCELIWRYISGGASEWSGTAEAVRTAIFTINYEGISPSANAMYVCHRSPPAGLYRQICETPLRRPCSLAERYERHRGGADYRPLCAAAQERGLALSIALQSPLTGCD